MESQAGRSRPPKKTDLTRLVTLFERSSRSCLGVLVGVILLVLFAAVILAVLYAALRSSGEQSTGLFNTAVTLVASALSAVIGFAYGRNGARG